MKKIERNFTRGGFIHRQIKRIGKVAIFERQGLKCPDPHYEVVKISSHNGYNLGGAYIDAAETYPGASLWGLQGWTHSDLPAAEENFKIVCKRFNNRPVAQPV